MLSEKWNQVNKTLFNTGRTALLFSSYWCFTNAVSPCAFLGTPPTLLEWLCGGRDYLLRTVLPLHGGSPKAAWQVKYYCYVSFLMSRIYLTLLLENMRFFISAMIHSCSEPHDWSICEKCTSNPHQCFSNGTCVLLLLIIVLMYSDCKEDESFYSLSFWCYSLLEPDSSNKSVLTMFLSFVFVNI